MQYDSRQMSERIDEVIEKYSNTIFKICVVITGNEYDAEDALQETFLKYIRRSPSFQNEEHEKAWLIRVATNVCNDIHRYKMRNQHVTMDEVQEIATPTTKEQGMILEELRSLDQKYRIVLMLFYIEGYKTQEIATILDISVAAVKKRLQRGRQLLKIEYERGKW